MPRVEAYGSSFVCLFVSQSVIPSFYYGTSLICTNCCYHQLLIWSEDWSMLAGEIPLSLVGYAMRKMKVREFGLQLQLQNTLLCHEE